MEWTTKNERHLSDLALDENLDDVEYCEALEDLIDRAQNALDAKRAEMDEPAEGAPETEEG